LEQSCVDVKKELDAAEEKEQTLSATAMDKKQKLDLAEEKLRDYQRKLNHWKKEVSSYRLISLKIFSWVFADQTPEIEQPDRFETNRRLQGQEIRGSVGCNRKRVACQTGTGRFGPRDE